MKEYLTLSEACIMLGISKSTMYKKTHNRILGFSKPGGKLIRFLKSDLENYLASNHHSSKDEIEQQFLSQLQKIKK